MRTRRYQYRYSNLFLQEEESLSTDHSCQFTSSSIVPDRQIHPSTLRIKKKKKKTPPLQTTKTIPRHATSISRLHNFHVSRKYCAAINLPARCPANNPAAFLRPAVHARVTRADRPASSLSRFRPFPFFFFLVARENYFHAVSSSRRKKIFTRHAEPRKTSPPPCILIILSSRRRGVPARGTRRPYQNREYLRRRRRRVEPNLCRSFKHGTVFHERVCTNELVGEYRIRIAFLQFREERLFVVTNDELNFMLVRCAQMKLSSFRMYEW